LNNNTTNAMNSICLQPCFCFAPCSLRYAFFSDKFQSPERLTSSNALRYSIPDPQSGSLFQCEALNLLNATTL